MYGPRIAAELRRSGADVVAAAERPELRGRTDQEILSLAAQDRRAVVTENVGDFSRLFERFARVDLHHAGIVLVSGRRFPRSPARSGELVRALVALLRGHSGDDALRDALVWL